MEDTLGPELQCRMCDRVKRCPVVAENGLGEQRGLCLTCINMILYQIHVVQEHPGRDCDMMPNIDEDGDISPFSEKDAKDTASAIAKLLRGHQD